MQTQRTTNTTFYCILALLVLVILLFGCSSSRKIKTVESSRVDSSAVVKVDSSTSLRTDSIGEKKDLTVTTEEKEEEYKKVTVVEFDSSKRVGLTPTFSTPAEDFFLPVKKITVTETGTKREKKTIANDITDSGRRITDLKNELDRQTAINLQKRATAKAKTSTRPSFSLAPYITFAGALILFALGWYLGWWRWIYGRLRWFFAAAKKRRRDQQSKSQNGHNETG